MSNQVTYHYLIMSQKDFLESEALEETLRERANYFQIRGRFRDFWVLISPTFLYSSDIYSKIKLTNFYDQQKSLINGKNILEKDTFDFFACLISIDKEFMNWIQLRLGDFENINEVSQENQNKKKFKSNGIYGSLNNHYIKFPLQSYQNYIHPEILLEKNKKFLEAYYELTQKDIFKQIQ